jgi:REP element-mobilizing transposase RayT
MEEPMNTRRRWRWPDGYYHVFNRGSRRLHIFADERDRANFIRLLGKTALKQGVAVIAYLLMDNHYHLILRCSGEAMGRMIRDLEKTYSRQYNRRTGFTGTLFEGRFGSVWLPDLETVAYVTRYVHANCRDKGIAPENYFWSSCRAYLGRARVPAWLDPKPVLDWVGGPEAYARYLKEVPPLRPRRPHAEDEAQAVFIEHLEERVRAKLSALPPLKKPLSLKMMVCWIAVRAFAVRPRVLARVLGFSSGNCVSVGVQRMSGYLEERPSLKTALSEVLIK